jgi:hypothetical protein
MMHRAATGQAAHTGGARPEQKALCAGTDPMWGRDLPRKINPTRLGFAASSQEIERPSKLDQADGRKDDPTSRCRRFLGDPCPHGGAAP